MKVSHAVAGAGPHRLLQHIERHGRGSVGNLRVRLRRSASDYLSDNRSVPKRTPEDVAGHASGAEVAAAPGRGGPVKCLAVKGSGVRIPSAPPKVPYANQPRQDHRRGFRCPTSGDARRRTPRDSPGAPGRPGSPARCPRRGQMPGCVREVLGVSRRFLPVGREELGKGLDQVGVLDRAVDVDDEFLKDSRAPATRVSAASSIPATPVPGMEDNTSKDLTLEKIATRATGT